MLMVLNINKKLMNDYAPKQNFYNFKSIESATGNGSKSYAATAGTSFEMDP